MISIFKKQFLLGMLMLGIACPLSAMDSQESNSWFGWKTAAGISAVVCVGIAYLAYKKWTKPTEGIDEFQLIESDEVSGKRAKKNQQKQQAQKTAQDSEDAQIEKELEELERHNKEAQDKLIAMGVFKKEDFQTSVVNQQDAVAQPKTKPSLPNGPGGRRAPVRKNTQQEFSSTESGEVIAKEPIQASSDPEMGEQSGEQVIEESQVRKPVGAKGYGVNLGQLNATKLKKTVKAAVKK